MNSSQLVRQSMLRFIKKIIIREYITVIDDVFHHVIYTILIILISACVTYIVIKKVNSQSSSLPTTVINTSNYDTASTSALTDDTANFYTERGSPYDYRTIGSESSNIIFHGPRNKKKIALTFDAEMTEGMKAAVVSGKVPPSYDKKIIDSLIATNTKATFFLTGLWIEMYPDITRQLSDNSLFELGSHSYTDSSYAGFCYGLKQLDNTLKIEDIGATEKLLREHAGIDNQLFRFPGGCYTPTDVKLVNQANDTVIHWDVVGADGFNSSTNQIIRNVVDNTQNGSIIVLHMNGLPTAPKTGNALPLIISKLKAKGFEFVKIYELLGMHPEKRQPQIP